MEEHKCSQCDKTYASQLALKVHFRGKHGAGYPYPKCGKAFDAPIKKAYHLRKCQRSVEPMATDESNLEDLSQAVLKVSPEGATD